MSNIEVILPDNSKISLEDGANGFDLAKTISEGLLKNAVALEINGEVKDIRTTLSNNDKVKILTAKDHETLAILRHSTSHVMAQAVIALFPQAKLAIGPAIENVFYYDFDLEGHTFTEEDLSKIEEKMKNILCLMLMLKSTNSNHKAKYIKLNCLKNTETTNQHCSLQRIKMATLCSMTFVPALTFQTLLLSRLLN